MISHFKETFLNIKIEHKSMIRFFAIIFILRFLFTVFVPLIDDEAYHWSWTRHLSLSYFDHPGMVAWLEKISILIFGETYLGVRFPFFICYSLSVALIWLFCYELFGEKPAHLTACLFLFTPFWGFGGFVSSPEPPFILLWLLSGYVFWQGMREDGKAWSAKKTWLTLGVLVGLGLNSKFPTILLCGSFFFYLILTPHRRRDFLTPWPWIGFLIALCFTAPIVIWNIENDFPSFKFQFQERHQGESFSITRWLGFFVAQISFLTPVVYTFVIAAFVNSIAKFKTDTKWRILCCLALPSFIVFYPQPFRADYKPHWSGPAYMFLSMGASYLWFYGFELFNKKIFQPMSKIALYGTLIFIIPINLLIYIPLFYPVAPKIYKAINPDKEWNIKWDLSNEFYGWEALGEYVNQRQKEVESITGKKPFLASHRYETTAQTYWGTKQRVYMLAKTRSHYTAMQLIEGIDHLVGQDALFITSEKYNHDPLRFAQFDSCEKNEFKYYRADKLARVFNVYYCRNFQKILR